MTTEEKAAAFDLLASVLVNRWHDGTYSAWGGAMWDLPHRATKAEAIPDLLEWAKQWGDYKAKRMRVGGRTHLALVSDSPGACP